MDDVIGNRIVVALEDLTREIKILRTVLSDVSEQGTTGDRGITLAIQELKEVIK